MDVRADELTYFRWRKPSAGYQWADAQRTEIGQCLETDAAERFLITAIPGHTAQGATEYAPLATKTGLFRQLAETSPNEAGILAFANEYGNLGGKISTSIQLNGEPFLRSLGGESLTEWKHAIAQIRAMLVIWETARNSTGLDELSNYIQWNENGDGVFYSTGDNESELIASTHTPELLARFTRGDLAEPAMYLLQRRVNQQLLDHRVAPKLFWNSDGQLVIRLSPNSLIGALWLQFAKAIEGNKTYRQCQNCRDWIEVGGNRTARSDKKFCTPSCKSAFHRPKKSA